jgi:hypothetical protein
MPAGAIGLGLRQRSGDPQPRELGHPPLLHQTLTVADDFAAGLPTLVPTGLSGEHHAAGGEVPSHEPSDPGAGDGERNMPRSRQPRHAPRPGHAHLLLARALITPGITPIVR